MHVVWCSPDEIAVSGIQKISPILCEVSRLSAVSICEVSGGQQEQWQFCSRDESISGVLGPIKDIAEEFSTLKPTCFIEELLDNLCK